MNKSRMKAIILSEAEANKLEIILLMAEAHLEREAASWKRLSEETDESGKPKIRNAKANKNWYFETLTTLKTLQKILELA